MSYEPLIRNFSPDQSASIAATLTSTHPVGGIVNLSERRAEERRFFWEVRSGGSARLGDLAPSRKGSLARSAAEVSSGGFGIGDVEEVRDLIVNGQEPLRLSS